MSTETKDSIEVFLCHPQGEFWVPLSAWQHDGPGPLQDILKPTRARDAQTGRELPLKVVPLPYRNDWMSRQLIGWGVIRNPWD